MIVVEKGSVPGAITHTRTINETELQLQHKKAQGGEEKKWGGGAFGKGDQVIRENPASRGTETSAEVLVGPPLGAEGWSETPVNSSGTRLTLALGGGLEGPLRPAITPYHNR